MRIVFQEQLNELNKQLISMGALCESAIAMSAKALENGDLKLAADVQQTASEIDSKEREIETMCMKLLLQQQPVASDLRLISAALKMVTDMERIGNQSADIAEIITMANVKSIDKSLHILDMARAAIKMVTDSVDSFVAKDEVAAKAVIDYDDVVDGYFNEIKTELVKRCAEPEANPEYILDMLMIAKYLERIADHAANIGEWVVFAVTGNH